MQPTITLAVDHRYVTSYGREIEIVSRTGVTIKTRCGQTFKVSRKLSTPECEVATHVCPGIIVRSSSCLIPECA